MRRMQDHLAEPPVGRLADLAASLQRFQVVEGEIHGSVAPREDRVADEGLDPFDYGGFYTHDYTYNNTHSMRCPMSFPSPVASRVPKRPVESDRDAAVSPPLSVRLAAGRSRPGPGTLRNGPGTPGTRLVVLGDPSGGTSATPSSPDRAG